MLDQQKGEGVERREGGAAVVCSLRPWTTSVDVPEVLKA